VVLGSGNAAEPQHQDSIVAGSGNSGHPIIAHGDVYLGQNSASSLEMKKEIQAGPPAVQREVEELDLELVPHGDNDDSIYLEVRNRGDAINLSAQIQIVGSTNTSFKTWPFAGQWKNEVKTTDFYNQEPEFIAGDVRIERDRSRLLAIASIDSMVGMATQGMAIVGIDNESVEWEFNPSQIKELPYFTVRISLAAKGYEKTKEKTYKVGPKTSHGPFQMTGVLG
jgi:hypothetical protein